MRVVNKMQVLTQKLGKYGLLWGFIFFGSFVVHAGTAVLRLNSFFPTPKAVDYASYYAGAWAIRDGISPYQVWPDAFLQFLNDAQQLGHNPPVHNSTPMWAWLMQPFTLFEYPLSATIWIVLLVCISMFVHGYLAKLAGIQSLLLRVVTLPVTLCFGSLVLNLTLGQNGIILLFSAIILGWMIGTRPKSWVVTTAVFLLWGIAITAKIYPVFWIGTFLLLGRWKQFLHAIALMGILFGGWILFMKDLTLMYFTEFLPQQTALFADKVNVDDQAISAFLHRIGQETSFHMPGLQVDERTFHTWHPPVSFSDQWIDYCTMGILFLVALYIFVRWMQYRSAVTESLLYVAVLYSLLIFPHMDRYNHVLVLPAMAWLWGRGQTGRIFAIIAYALFAVSRLTHLWVSILPMPVNIIVSGAGLFGVLFLIYAVCMSWGHRFSEEKI